MKNIIYLTVLFFIGLTNSFAQKSFSIKGKIIDEQNKPIESATVYLSTANDSTLINYTITDAKGEFELATKEVQVPTFVVATLLGFEDYRKDFTSIKESFLIETITMREDSDVLDELVIKADVAPIRIKQDTIEFNAASFKVRPDSNVKALLEQLPGVTVDPDGKIKFNGKEVPNILVNGKPFFGADGKIAIENLPAELINKVQVSDLKTKEEKLTGKQSEGDSVSINLTIDEDKNKGFFGRITGGYGSDDRYESSLLFNYFKGDSKFSVLSSSNNVNSTGFSMDEVFDNMKGGRNSWSSNSNFIDEYSGSDGITTSNLVGINYNDSFKKKVDVAASYMLNDQDNVTKSSSRTENLLPENKVISFNEKEGKNFKNEHLFNLDFEIKIDSTTTLAFVPQYKKSNDKSYFNSKSDYFSEQNELINASDQKYFKDADSDSFINELILSKRFKNKNTFSLNLKNENTNNKGFAKNEVQSIFNQGDNPDDIRNQNWLTNGRKDVYKLNLEYSIKIDNKQTLRLNTGFENAVETDNKETLDFNAITSQYSDLNELQSFNNKFQTEEILAGVGYELNHKAGMFRLGLGSRLAQFEMKSLYNNDVFLNEKTEVLPELSLSNSWKFGKAARLYVSYRYRGSLPSMNQLLEYQDLSSTISVRQGNRDLKSKLTNSLNVNFNNYDFMTRSGYYFYFGGSLDSRGVMNVTSYDDGFKSFITYENTNNTGYYYFGGSYNKSYKLGVNTLSYDLNLNSYGNKYKGKTNDVLYSALSQSYSPTLKLTWDYDKLITISPSYTYDFNKVKYKNYLLDESNNFTHKLNLQLTTYWPKSLVFGTDLGYNYNSMLSSGYKKDFMLLNMSLGYKFFNDQFTAKVKGYDLLNQNLSTSRYIGPTSIMDYDQLILKRYVMFSLTYKLDKFAGKKKEENNFIAF